MAAPETEVPNMYEKSHVSHVNEPKEKVFTYLINYTTTVHCESYVPIIASYDRWKFVPITVIGNARARMDRNIVSMPKIFP